MDTLDYLVGQTITKISIIPDQKHLHSLILDVKQNSDDDSDDDSDNDSDDDSNADFYNFRQCVISTESSCCEPSWLVIKDMSEFSKIIGCKIKSVKSKALEYKLPKYLNNKQDLPDHCVRIYLNSDNKTNVFFEFCYDSKGYYDSRLTVKII